jgi:hypothetical protein
MTADYQVSARAMVSREVDVLVLGGGMAGVFAALGAKTATNRVVVVEPANVLGGQGTTGGVAGFVGDSARVNTPFRRLVERLAACGKIDPYRPNDDRRAYDLETCAFVLQEMVDAAGIEIWLHAAALDVRRDGRRIREVLVRCGPSLVRVAAGIVVDATGNAVVADVAGEETLHLGALKQLPMSLYFTLWDTGRPVEPFLPPGCPSWETSDDLPMTSLHPFADGRIEVKMKVVGFDAADGFSLSRAEIHARRQMMGLVHHLQTRGYQGRHTVDGGRPLSTYTLASVSRAIGQREGRRIVGRVRLTDADVRSAASFADAVAVGTYHLDLHWTDTDRRAGTGVTDMVEPYHIPLAAMRPAGLDNVLCPGRSLSGDQLALSSYRAMTTCAQMGFGAGTAAALALETGATLDSIDLDTLRRRLAAADQSLDLADYGDYLRCLRVIDDAVPLTRAAGANGGGRLTLARTADGATWVERHDAAGTTRAALRRRTRWQPVPATGAPAPVDGPFAEPVARATPDAGGTPDTPAPLPLEMRLRIDPAGIVVHAEPLPPAAAGRPGPPRRHRDDAGGGEEDPGDDAGGAIVGRCVARCRIGDGEARLILAPDGRGATALVVLLVDPARCVVTLQRVVDRDADPHGRPALIATAIGFALAWDRADGTTRFFEASVERLAPLGAPPPDEARLQALPYADHVVLARGDR